MFRLPLRGQSMTQDSSTVYWLKGCRVWHWVWLVVACCVGGPLADGDEGRKSDLHLANDRLQATQLVDIPMDNRLEFQVAGQSRTIVPGDIVRWGAARPSGGAPLVWLMDGSWLAGQIRWKSPQMLELLSDWFVPIELDVDRVRGIIFQPPPSMRRWAELAEEMQAARGAEDVVWTAAEQISGVVAMSLHRTDAAEPALIPEWTLTKAGRPGLVIDGSELRAIVFSPVLRPALAEVTRGLSVGFRDGSRLNVSTLVRKPQQVMVELVDHYQLQSMDASLQFAEAIVSLTGNPAGVQWLGDTEPARYRIIAEQGQLNWPLGRDRDLFKQKLWRAGQPVDHGVCMHAPSQAAYRWDGTPGRLLAELSLLTQTPESSIGSIEGKVLLARGGALEEVYVSSMLRPTSPAEYVAVDLTNAQLVVLLIGEADQGPIGDHAVWREARLVRQAQP